MRLALSLPVRLFYGWPEEPRYVIDLLWVGTVSRVQRFLYDDIETMTDDELCIGVDGYLLPFTSGLGFAFPEKIPWKIRQLHTRAAREKVFPRR